MACAALAERAIQGFKRECPAAPLGACPLGGLVLWQRRFESDGCQSGRGTWASSVRAGLSGRMADMLRPRRLPFGSFTAFSLLLCVGVVILCVRSYRGRDTAGVDLGRCG